MATWLALFIEAGVCHLVGRNVADHKRIRTVFVLSVSKKDERRDMIGPCHDHSEPVIEQVFPRITLPRESSPMSQPNQPLVRSARPTRWKASTASTQ